MQQSIYIKKEFIEQTLLNAPIKGSRGLEPLKSFSKENNVPLCIVEDQEVVNEAEAHINMGDLWHCIEGSTEFICGGKLINPSPRKSVDGNINKKELKGKGIKGGSTIIMKAGDWLWIPAGQPHQHNTRGMARLFIIKIPTV